jgi:hypothetical protein
MCPTIDVRQRAALLHLDAQLLEFAVEQHDVSDHEVAGVRPDQRRQAPGLLQVVRHGLL